MTSESRLAGKRILVVEDEYFIAADLKRLLQRADAIVVGPVSRLEEGLSLVDAGEIDAAVLDVNLDGPKTFPLADRLAALDVPCMFVTGYDGWSLPAAYRDAPRLTKPFSSAAMLDAVANLFAEPTPCSTPSP